MRKIEMQDIEQEPIAIIGMGCRFPRANNLQEFWTLLHTGQDALQEVPAHRWDIQRLYDPDRTVPGKMASRWGGFLDQVDQFDWRAFRMLPREATAMDPQHRLLLEVAWEALEDAGLPLEQVAGSQTSVSLGIGWNDYLRLRARNWSQLDDYTALGNADGAAAHRLSYFFDLRGPSVAVNSLCTSGLSALHLACQSLWAGEASLALAGGVSLTLSPDSMIMVSQAGLLSADGRCKTLDAAADGYVRGEGAGIVVLKPLSQVSGSDRVYALIRAIAANHNGHNEWIIAASQTAQEALLRDAYRKAGLHPAQVDYVELHGTGFVRGDSIETAALGAVLGNCLERTHPCFVGSVKTNIGHLDAASGIASVMKVALSLFHQHIPPTLNLETLNPDIHLSDLHLAVPQMCIPWPEKAAETAYPQVAGVTTLAFSGANAHAVLTAYRSQVDEEQRQHENDDEQVYRLLPVSARDKPALDELAAAYRDFLCTAETAPAFRDICYTASLRRTHHSYRLAVVGRTPQEAVAQLNVYLQEQGQQEPLRLPDPHQQDLPPRLAALKALYMQGAEIDWSELYGQEQYRCVSLPPYAWQRERLWPDWLDIEEISTPPEERAPAPHRLHLSSPNKIEISGREVVDVLTDLWADVLGLEKVDAGASFFALGGHSLQAQRLLTYIREVLQVELTLKDILTAPTPSACAVLIRRAQELGASRTGDVLIEPDPKHRYEPFPTTDVQQAYWVGRYAAESGNVGNHGYIEVEATDLDFERFERALRRLIERHDMLRAVILPDGQQQVLAQVPLFELKIVDLRGQESQIQVGQLGHIRQTLDHQILPVERWPAFALWISLLDEQHVRLHLSIESIFVDAWSMNTLIHEFICLYYEPDLLLPAPTLSFRDYVLAEVSLRNSVAHQRARDYWLERLSSLPPAPLLPLVPENERTWQRPHFVHREARLERAHWQQLKAHAAKIGVTPSGVLLTAFAEVIARWSKTAHFSLNLSTFNRLSLHREVNEIVGDFTSLLVLAVDHTSPATFENRARCMQEQVWKDLDHSSYSGIAVLRELVKMQGEGFSAIMPIVFTSLLITDTTNPLPPPWGKTLYCVSQTPQVWLDHQVLETGGELVFHWQSVDAMFPSGLIDDMFEAYCQLLQDLAIRQESWSQAVRDILPEHQRALFAQVNATEAPVSDKLLHTLFHEQVAQRPDQLAVMSATRLLTYKQVATGALQLAHQLRAWRVRPNQLVAVVMEKGWEQVVAVLGILHSGAAYLPLDASLPRERLWYLLEDGQVEVVVTQSWVDRRTAWPEHVKRIWVDSLDLDEEDIPELKSLQHPTDLAYVIYTSGSTGVPKGVMIDHRGAVNTILDINRRFAINSADRVLALSALNFDLSVYDIFGLLAAGGTIVLLNEKMLRDPASWLRMIEQEQITIWNTVPALMQVLVEYVEAHSRRAGSDTGPTPISPFPEHLRLALLGGDWIPLTLPDRLKQLYPHIEVISLGGATEASIWSILYPIETPDHAHKPWSCSSIPYGRPMDNQQFFVLNDDLVACPVWVPGRLYIAGIGLARGYWRDGEKTLASFFEHPRTGVRLYRTGDLGRYLPDGTIEFLGREDFQVKVQGHRIELGEIEATLVHHPAIQEAVVIALGENLDEKRLVACLVKKPSYALTTDDVRHFLAQRLPSYMVPTSLLFLDALPLSPNGKVDRKALSTQASSLQRPEAVDTGQASGTLSAQKSALVAQITELIAGVLKVERIDPTRNLLEYGATSMNIFRIANLLESQLHIHLEFSQLFRLSSINAIAAFSTSNSISNQRKDTGSVNLPRGKEYTANPNESSGNALALTSEVGRNHISASSNLILDPVARERFKSTQPGLRHVRSTTPAVQLMVPELKNGILHQYAERRSARTFLQQPLSFRQFSALLGCLRQITLGGKPRYQWGSAGGLYPVQAYVYIKPGRIEGFDDGIYYYHPVIHQLSLITPLVQLEGEVFGFANQHIFEQAAFVLFLIGQMKAMEPLYGELSRDFCLLEAGEIVQLLEMSAPGHQIALCQTGGIGFKKIEHLFALEEGSIYLHSLLGGALDVNTQDTAPDPTQLYEPFPITDVQQAYWIGRNTTFELGRVGNHGYIEVEAVDLDLARSLLILRQLIKRHPMLRAIMLPDGQQQILEHVPPLCIAYSDLSGLKQQDMATQLAHIREAMDHQVFAVEQWPALEIRLSRLHKRCIRIHISIESLFVDAWSIRILIQEFIHLYHEPELPLPPLALSFRDYVLAELRLQDTELYRRSRDYWAARLADLPAAPELPLAIDPATLSRPRFVHREARIEAELWQQLKAHGARAGLTPSGILLAAFAEVLTVWSKSPRFCINLTTFNRLPLHEEVNALVGDFTSLLMLAVDNSLPASFAQRARNLQEQMWRDFDHRYYSGVRVLRDLARLRRERDRPLSTQAMMPVVFTSLLAEVSAQKHPAPWQEIIYCVTQTPQVWLDHQVLEEGGNLLLYWQAVETLFPPGLLDAMFEAYTSFLHRLATDDELWQAPSCELLPNSQLAQWASLNATETAFPEGLLHSFFLEQVAKRPRQLAVVSTKRTLTYQQTLHEAMVLGHKLRQLGACPNQLVAVVMEKGWEQVVGVLAVLLSGAAYLPIDPRLPQERVTWLLEHGQVEFLLTQSWLDKRIAWPEDVQHICVDSLDLDQEEVKRLNPVQSPDDLAYVIYTSGSTGLPKGVMIDHRGAVNTILDINQRFGVSSMDRVLALSALNFDLSVYDIFGLLAAGGTIVVPPEESLRDPAAWLDLLVRERVTIWNTVPALLQILVDSIELTNSLWQQTSLRLVLLSGDWIPLPLPEQVKERLPALQVISLGGATEASIWSILYPIHATLPSWKSIPYGKPMRNQRLFVLNHMLEPCPIWVPGHLYIGGVGLAMGYWRDEEKTQASFFHHPLTGERLYRTGDLGRYLPDGNIEFLGREDFQVKIQGHRIELGEIERTLSWHPAVQAAIVTTINDPHGHKRLLAYVVLRESAETGQPQETVPADEMYDDALSHLAVGFGQTSIRQEIDKRLVIDVAHPTNHPDTLQAHRERLSYRQFLPEPIPFWQFSAFLSTLSQAELEGLPKYRYPSAGGIYPVQTYLAIKAQRVEGVPGGIYYYNPQSSQLVMLAEHMHPDSGIHAPINQPIFDESAFSLFLIGDLTTISTLYGESARDFCLLEAGYMGQLLMMTAVQQHIGLCPVGGLNFEPIRASFLLTERHLLLHTLLGGRVDPGRSTGWSFLPGNKTNVAGEASRELAPSTNPTMTGQTGRLASPVTIAMLYTFLKEKLPEYMLPSDIMVLESLPLTANGKVDRKNLPVPQTPSNRPGTEYRAPILELERTIAAVWQEALGHEKVGIDDNFFDLGGNSLLMVRAYARLRKILDCDLSIIEMFFQYPTIHTLAEFLTQRVEQQVQPSPPHDVEQPQRTERRKVSRQRERLTRLRHRASVAGPTHTERDRQDA